ncbi:hypothetical protein [Erythrobacter aureus]|uniref:Uncharacterized protein n=1 Tax=Erythrobacter aureus TaxID=2182384 RepID=A0A345YJF5_9SPHN|nr:hypothetical protein [Erythrobacter aureus]AXK44057.1 hypothetical protein DVR09_16520 [Erythrobacter aureus]
MTAQLQFDDFVDAAPVALKRRPAGDDKPLLLTRAEIKLLGELSEECGRLLKITGLSTSHQVGAMHSALAGVEAAYGREWNGILKAAVAGIEACNQVMGVSPYIFQHTDGASRNLASPQRVALKEMGLRISLATRPMSLEDNDTALCMRAMVFAAIAAERGLIHLAIENFGAIIRTLHSELSPLREYIAWDDKTNALAARFANAKVKLP